MSNDDMQELNDRNLVPADEIDHLNILRYDKRDPPTVGIFDAPLRCYPVNEEWAKHIMGAVSGLEFWKAWTGEEDELNSAVQSIYEFMVGEVCGMFLLRQSTTEPCLLEQSQDGGESWTPAFDYSLCASGGSDASIAIYINIAIANILTLNLAYIDASQDITIMYPNVEYDAGPEDADRDTALCYSIEALTEGLFNAAEAMINQQLSRGNFLSSLVSAFTAGFWASEGSLLAALSQSVTDAIFGTPALQAASDALANTSARREVVCCIYDNMQGETAIFTLWNDAGDGCGFAPASDAALLLAVLEPLFAGLDAYLSWVTLLSNGVDMAIADIIGNDCLDCDVWEAFIDFSIDDGGFVQDLNYREDGLGVYVASTGWVGEVGINPGNEGYEENGLDIMLEFAAPLPTIKYMSVNFDYVEGTWTGTAQTAVALWKRDDTIETQSRSATSNGDDQSFETDEALVTDSDRLHVFLRSANRLLAESGDGSCQANSLTVRGTGDVPPELTDYIV